MVCPPHRQWVEVKKPWPWPRRPRSSPFDHGEGAAFLQIELMWWHSSSSRSFLQPEAHVVGVRLGRPPSPLVQELARSVAVRLPDKRVVARGGGCHPTVESPTLVKWFSGRGVVVVEVGETSTPDLPRKGRSVLPPRWESWGAPQFGIPSWSAAGVVAHRGWGS
jgi:hypothetical protein